MVKRRRRYRHQSDSCTPYATLDRAIVALSIGKPKGKHIFFYNNACIIKLFNLSLQVEMWAHLQAHSMLVRTIHKSLVLKSLTPLRDLFTNSHE